MVDMKNKYIVPVIDGYMFYGAKAVITHLGLGEDELNYFNVRLFRKAATIKGYEFEYISISKDLYKSLKKVKILPLDIEYEEVK